jgi:hypothetical protein
MGRREVISYGDGEGATTLENWIATHGPLWVSDAFTIVLDICARASKLSDVELDRVIGSLSTVCIVRGAKGGWLWVPARASAAAGGTRDADIIERLGAILFHCLTGRALEYPLAEESRLRTMLRTLRPDLPASAADVTIEAVRARPSSLTLAGFARQVRQVLGVEREVGGQSSRFVKSALASAVVTAIIIGLWFATAGETLLPNGLTSDETVMIDVQAETALTDALIDEHTSAIQMYQQILRLWRGRLSPQDPRLAWTESHEAWVRTLANDRLTTEQGLQYRTESLVKELGAHHPYTRTVRLGLASTLEARGATTEAEALRTAAAKAMHDLLPEPSVVDNDPVPPGVIAHVAPNLPEREGFRFDLNGGFFVPLLSMQRRLAEETGWRLHLVASGPCQTSVAAGARPHTVTLITERPHDRRWRIRVLGTEPEMTLEGASADSVQVSLHGDKNAVEMTVGDRHAMSTIDPKTERPNPPYTLTFDSSDRCSVVWLEIPFPKHGFRNR